MNRLRLTREISSNPSQARESVSYNNLLPTILQAPLLPMVDGQPELEQVSEWVLRHGLVGHVSAATTFPLSTSGPSLFTPNGQLKRGSF